MQPQFHQRSLFYRSWYKCSNCWSTLKLFNKLVDRNSVQGVCLKYKGSFRRHILSAFEQTKLAPNQRNFILLLSLSIWNMLQPHVFNNISVTIVWLYYVSIRCFTFWTDLNNASVKLCVLFFKEFSFKRSAFPLDLQSCPSMCKL